MIRINLLPVKEQIRISAGIRQLWLMGAAIVILLAILGGYNVKLGRENDTKREEITRVKAEIKRLEDLIGEVNQLEGDRNKLLKQLGVIRKLEKGKTGPVRMMDGLASAIPKRVWVTQMSERGQNLSISGYGIENSDISDFMNALDKHPMFSGVALKFTQKQELNKQTVFQFSMNLSVNYNN